MTSLSTYQINQGNLLIQFCFVMVCTKDFFFQFSSIWIRIKSNEMFRDKRDRFL